MVDERFDRPNVVFLPYSETSWSRMMPQIRALASSAVARPHVVLATSRVMQFAAACAELGVSSTVIEPIEPHDRGDFPRIEARFPNDRICHSLPLGLLRMHRVRRRLEDERRRFSELYATLDARAVFVQGDRELGPNLGALAAAGAARIPRIVAAPGIPSIRAMATLRRGNPRFFVDWKGLPPLLNLVAAARYPGQVRATEFGRLLFSPGWLTLALGSAGVLSANPWCIGGGLSDHVIVDGALKRRQFIELGVDPGKLVLIGDLDLDSLHEAWQQAAVSRRTLMERYRLAPGHPVIVFALPIYGEHALMPMDRHIAELERVFATLAGRHNVLLSLHPRARAETYADMAARHGLPIAEERLFQLLPAADLFLCGSSTTIEWAVLCGVPTINVDYCGLNDDAFHRYKGVIRVETAQEITQALGRFAGDPEWRESLKREQRRAAQDHATFDGRARDRFLSFVGNLVVRGATGLAADKDSSAA